MGDFINSRGWQNCLQTRAKQRYWGALCALLLGFVMLGMLDGLQGLARSGADVIEVLPGGSVPISGPLTIKNPVNSDLKAQFTPETPALVYELEGFFSGYWFGNGMWRAAVRADAKANRQALLAQRRPLLKEIEQLERKLAKWNEEKAALETAFADPEFYATVDRAKSEEMHRQAGLLGEQIDAAEMRWLEAHEALETLPSID